MVIVQSSDRSRYDYMEHNECMIILEAIIVFKKMNSVRDTPNTITMVNLLKACSSSSELDISNWAHAIAIRRGLALDVVVGTTILDMYAKCGVIDTSRKVFNQISQKNIVSVVIRIS
ncbi:hypothetical protein POM88_021547 [Heracleum sosnowskyi]|uniref:Pentatricopeptide repeat-containing protein n=1 Tax=Heracleum sosnowskyi TaxID=360622 RepID=A0AAD8IDE2_9APIA|nr:hypothetical protein POM88_021547 [Heracleum sosnowskyi]